MIKRDELTNVMKQLQAPFPPDDIEWRVQQSGFDKNGNGWALIMPYVTSRAIQTRLDEVVGLGNWKNEFREIKTDRGLSFLCGLSLLIECNDDYMKEDWITKWDGADETDFESFKGGISNSMKRAGVQIGIGRYLYGLDTYFADLREDKSGRFKVKITSKDKSTSKWYSYNSPELPSWALPNSTGVAKAKPENKHDEVLKASGARNLTEEANNCKTIEELANWWNNLPSDMKKTGSPAIGVKNERKRELTEVKKTPPKVEKETKENPYDFLVLKKKTLAELKAIAKEVGVKGYGKMNKTNLITAIIKEKGE